MLKLLLFLISVSSLLLSGCSTFDAGDPYSYASNNEALSVHLKSLNNHTPTSYAKPMASAASMTQTAQKEKPKSYPYDDQKLSHEVLAALISQDGLKNSHIRVSGYYGDILILGEVPNQEAVELAQNIASSFQDVKSIQTALTIGENLPKSQRSEDSIKNTRVKSEIAKLDIPHSHLQVVTNNNQVFIVGPLNPADKQQIQYQLESLTYIDAVYFY